MVRGEISIPPPQPPVWLMKWILGQGGHGEENGLHVGTSHELHDAHEPGGAECIVPLLGRWRTRLSLSW